MDDKEGHGDGIFAPQIIYRFFFLKRQMIVIQYLCPPKAFKPVSSKAHGFFLVCALVCTAPLWIYVTYIRIRPPHTHKAFNHIPQGKKE